MPLVSFLIYLQAATVLCKAIRNLGTDIAMQIVYYLPTSDVHALTITCRGDTMLKRSVTPTVQGASELSLLQKIWKGNEISFPFLSHQNHSLLNNMEF
jgi:hypothetical protein